jgi:hypothetical protein
MYKDKNLEIKDHRLFLYDPGYFFDPALELFAQNHSEVTYSQRRMALQIIIYLKSNLRSNRAVLIGESSFYWLPFLANYLIEDNSRIAYFFIGSPSSIKINEISKEVSRSIVNYINDDKDLVLRKFEEHDAYKLAIVKGEDEGSIIRLINRPGHSKGHLSKILLSDYSRSYVKSLHWKIRAYDLFVLENADSSAEITLPEF